MSWTDPWPPAGSWCRGPTVALGAKPDPDGLRLEGYRGVDARHCVLTAHPGGVLTVTPVGRSQVRQAPHPNVRWESIDPLGQAVALSAGCAIHLGPPGRGCTLRLVRTQPMADWERGRASSDAGGMDVGEVSPTKVPLWFLGCLMVMATSTVATIGIATAIALLREPIPPLGPKDPGQARYESVSKEQLAHLHPSLQQGLDQGFSDLVVAPDVELAGQQRLLDRAAWDTDFYDYTAVAVDQHLSAWKVFKRLDAVRDDYALVVSALREAGLPEVFTGIPYVESLYRAREQSSACARGWWQYMPEVAWRLEQEGLDFQVRDCAFVGAPDVRWSPSLLAPPPRSAREYLDLDGQCRISDCRIDHRTDLARSTDAAVRTLSEDLDDPVLRASGAAVQIAILSHNAGYDDARFGYKRKTNLLPAYQAWSQTVDEEDRHRFYGRNILCDSHLSEGTCGSVLPAETQHYAYRVAAVHLIAVCYYGARYGEQRAFAPWRRYQDGYCAGLNVPLAEKVR